jgi:hypothetical protein
MTFWLNKGTRPAPQGDLIKGANPAPFFSGQNRPRFLPLSEMGNLEFLAKTFTTLVVKLVLANVYLAVLA